MLGELSERQINYVMESQVVGRLACFAGGRLYVVPMSYAFDGQYVYAHSKEGTKITMMRKNPEVSFEVDVIDNLANWRSVLIEGTYEELKTKPLQQKALAALADRFAPLWSGETLSRQYSRPPFEVEKKTKAILFRIKIARMSGRFEKTA